MSNRLALAPTTPRREPHEWLPAPRARALDAALRWLTGTADALSPAIERDLGLPESIGYPVAVAVEIERSRVRM